MRWWAAEATDRALLERAVAGLAGIERDGAAPGFEILKHRPARKLVYAYEGPDGAAVVAKVVWLDTFKRVLERRRFGPREAANLGEARGRGVNVPAPLATGFVPGRLGVPRRSVTIVTRFAGLRPAASLFAAPDADVDRLLDATLPLFASLHETATHHLDVNADNVLLDPTGEAPPGLIDLSHVVFGDGPSRAMLLFQTGWFARSCVTLEPVVIEAWFERLVDRFGPTGGAEDCLARLREHRTTDRSRAERVAMARAARDG